MQHNGLARGGRRLSGPRNLLAIYFRATPRGLTEFLIIVAVFACADPTTLSLAVGGLLSILGEVLRIITAGYGYEARAFAVRGPYRWVRHPHYLGTALVFIGFCLAGRDPYVMGGALVALAVLFRQGIATDEAWMASRLGPAFADYRARVPAFLPLLWPARVEGSSRDNHSFSLSLALLRGRHREFDTVLGTAVVFSLLFLAKTVAAKNLFHMGVMITVAVYVVGRFLYFATVKRAR